MRVELRESILRAWLPERKPILVGIAGGSGAGKSTLSASLRGRLGGLAVVIDQDSYYRCNRHLAAEQRRNINFDHPEAVDLGLLALHLRRLKEGRTIKKPLYDFQTHTRKRKSEHVEPAPVVIVEGLFLFVDEELRELFDLRVFVDAEADIRLARRLKRDILERNRTVESVISQYFETVKPMHEMFVAPGAGWAHCVVDARSGDGVDAVLRSLDSRTARHGGRKHQGGAAGHV